MAGINYIMEFKNIEEVLCRVIIGDNSAPDVPVPAQIPLDPAEDPVIISTVDEDEDKFNPILAQQAKITFHSTANVGLKTFADGPDDRFSVQIIVGAVTVFRGFLSLNDNEEPFLPPRNIVTLTANDKLAALKDIPLVTAFDENPDGLYRIAELISFCLIRTGLTLRINVIHNLRHGSGKLTALATFQESPDQIILATANADFFYEGQRIQITDTDNNNLTFNVTAVGKGIIAIVQGDEDFTSEIEVMATFTDITQDGHIYDKTYLDSKTFEKKIGESEDCNLVLRKILGRDCRLFQYNDEWWIVRIDELNEFPNYVAMFTSAGVFESMYSTNLLRSIGFNNDHWFSQEATIITPTRPVKFVQLDYLFKYPLEIICNQTFERGDFVEDLPQEADDDGLLQDVKKYEAECWTEESADNALGNVFDNYGEPPEPTADIYVKKFYLSGVEKFKELVIVGADDDTNVPYIKSQPIKVHNKDKIDFSVTMSYTEIGANTGFFNSPVMIVLFGNSGTMYFWEAGNVAIPNFVQKWTATASNLAIPQWYLGSDVDEPGQTLSFTSPPLPESGTLVFYLINFYVDGVVNHYSQLNISIIPFMNGSYQQYTGESEKVTRTEEGYLANVEDEVFIHDAERELFKGAMFSLVEGNYILTKRWYEAFKTALAIPTDLSTVKPFGKHQVFAVWNQFRLANTIFQFSMQGFGDIIPSLIHKFQVTDVHDMSTFRELMMLTAEKNLQKCEMTGVLEQCFHTQLNKDYDSTYEFKYLT